MKKIIRGFVVILLLCFLVGCSDKKEEYKARFLSWDDSLIEEMDVKTSVFEDIKNPPSAPLREGYTFEKWVSSFDQTTNVITIKAEYKINKFTIKYNTAGGDLINDEMHDFNTVVTLPIANRSGYDFTGWELDGEIATEITLTKNITLNATWIPKNFEYVTTENNTLTITRYTGLESDVVIPGQINGFIVNTRRAAICG